MARPASTRQTTRQAQGLLARRLPGARRTTVKAHLQRAGAIGETIYQRWQVGAYQWRVKHLRWYLEHRTQRLKPSARYRHWLTVRLLVIALGRESDWLPRLNGPWTRPVEARASRPGAGRPVNRPT